MTSERVRLDGAGKLVAWSVASAAYLFALPFWLPIVFGLDGADLVVRAGLCVLMLAPAGFLMGRPACDWFPRSMPGRCPGFGASTAVQVFSLQALPLSPALRSASIQRSGSELPAISWSPPQRYCWCSLVRDPTTQHHDSCTHSKARMCRIKIGRF